MKKLLYTEGPARVTMGVAGTFKRGVAKEVTDETAAALLKKKSLKFYEDGKVPEAALKQLKKLEELEAKAKEKPAEKPAAKKGAN